LQFVEEIVSLKSLNIKEGPILIAGPTASGKSSLAMKIANKFGGQIVNADAIQVFDGWRVLTARPSQADEEQFVHRLYGHIPVDGDYSVGHWIRDIKSILDDGTRPIIVGGTGLYFSALTQGLAEIPATPESIREQADALRMSGGIEEMLQVLNVETLGRIDQNNPMRVQRAWEVLQSTGRQISDWQNETPAPLLNLIDATAIVMNSPKEWLNERITRRFNMMIDDGALDEAQTNLETWDPSNLSSKAIGAPELIAYLKGEIELETAKERATIATRQYAKRQRTWFRSRMSKWVQFDPSID